MKHSVNQMERQNIDWKMMYGTYIAVKEFALKCITYQHINKKKKTCQKGKVCKDKSWIPISKWMILKLSIHF